MIEVARRCGFSRRSSVRSRSHRAAAASLASRRVSPELRAEAPAAAELRARLQRAAGLAVRLQRKVEPEARRRAAGLLGAPANPREVSPGLAVKLAVRESPWGVKPAVLPTAAPRAREARVTAVRWAYSTRRARAKGI